MDILGIVLSIAYIFLIIFISSLVSKNHSEISRKIVHIGVCNWWIIVIIFFENVWLASIVPLLFCIINYISYKKDIFKSMERDDKKSLGTVYYPTDPERITGRINCRSLYVVKNMKAGDNT